MKKVDIRKFLLISLLGILPKEPLLWAGYEEDLAALNFTVFTSSPIDFNMMFSSDPTSNPYPIESFWNFAHFNHVEGPRKWYMNIPALSNIYMPARGIVTPNDLSITVPESTLNGAAVYADVGVTIHLSSHVTVTLGHATIKKSFRDAIVNSSNGYAIFESGDIIGYSTVLDFAVADSRTDAGLTVFKNDPINIRANPLNYFSSETRNYILDAFQPYFDAMVANGGYDHGALEISSQNVNINGTIWGQWFKDDMNDPMEVAFNQRGGIVALLRRDQFDPRTYWKSLQEYSSASGRLISTTQLADGVTQGTSLYQGQPVAGWVTIVSGNEQEGILEVPPLYIGTVFLKYKLVPNSSSTYDDQLLMEGFGSLAQAQAAVEFSSNVVTYRHTRQRIGAISGRVTMADGTTPLPGALVEASDMRYSQAVGNDGTFYFESSTNSTTVQVSSAGYISSSSSVYVIANQTTTVIFALSPQTIDNPVLGVSASTGSLSWSWSDVSNEIGYRVLNISSANISGNLNSATTAWTETNLSANTSYSRKVQAYAGVTEGNSNWISKYTLARPPNDLTTLSVNSTSITLEWSGNGNPLETQYRIQYWALSNSTANLTVAQTSSSISDLNDNTTYFFQIYALNGESYTSTAISTTIVTNPIIPTPDPVPNNSSPSSTELYPVTSDATTNSLTFTWNSTGSSWIGVLSSNESVLSSGSLTSNSTTYTGLTSGMLYTFAVKISSESDMAYSNNSTYGSPSFYDYVSSSVSLLGGATVYTYYSTSTAAMDYGGVDYYLMAGTSMTVYSSSDSYGVIYEVTDSTYVSYGSGGIFNYYMSAGVETNVSTTPNGYYGFYSTAAYNTINIAGSSVSISYGAGINMYISTQADGAAVYSTQSANFDYGRNISIYTSSNVVIDISNVANGGWIFYSTASTRVDYSSGAINYAIPAKTYLNVIEGATGLTYLSTASAVTLSYGSGLNMNVRLPEAVPVSVSTVSAYANGWVFYSTATIGIGMGSTNVQFSSGIQTHVQKSTTGFVMQTTAYALVGLGNTMSFGLPAETNIAISSVGSAFASGNIMLSTSSIDLNVGLAPLTIPGGTPFDLQENTNGHIAFRSTSPAAHLLLGSELQVNLPAFVQTDLVVSSATAFILTSTVTIPLTNAGVTIGPSSGTVQTSISSGAFVVTISTNGNQNCDLIIPTTATKAFELNFTRRDSTSSTVGIHFEPNALGTNSDLDIQMPVSLPTATLSTTGEVLIGLSSTLGLEINHSSAVVIDISTGVPMTFSFTPDDISGFSTSSLRVCVYSSATASWEVLPSTAINVYSSSITAYAPHFSLYRLMSSRSGVTSSSGTISVDPNVTASTSVAISGGRGSITVDLPVGAFAETVSMTVAFSSSGFPSTVSNTTALSAVGIGVIITLDRSIQPLKDVTISVPYVASDATGKDESKFILARYDDTNSAWVPLVSSVDTTGRTVTARTNHFSTFQIMEATPGSSVQDAKVFPNPFRPPRGHTSVTFANLPANSTIKIYTLSGSLIRELTASASGLSSWDAKNASGESAASGVYFALIEGTGGKKILKVAIQK